MALVLANRVQETATPNTTVSFTLTGAVQGFQSFATIGNTNTTYYSATDTLGNWEVGLGTYSSTGPTLTRTTIYASSNSGSAVTFPGGVTVFVTYPSGKSVNLDATGNVSALGTVSSGTWQGSTVGVAYGGTGVTASSGANSVMLRDADQNTAINRLNQSNTNTTAAGGTTALAAASSYSHTLVGTGNQTFTLPDATTLTTGVAFLFNNRATGTVTIQDYATATIGTITAGGAGAVFLTDNSTVGGTWDVHGYLPEGVTWGTNALNLGSTVISNGTWQGGTIQSGYGGTGLTTFTGANNALYSTSASNLVAGTLPIAAGGTGVTTTPTNGQLLIGNGTNYTVASLGSGTGISTTTGAGTLTINNTGVTSLAGTSPVTASASTGSVTVSLASGYGDTQNPYASKTANYILAAPSGVAGVPSFRALTSTDIPALSYVSSVGATAPVSSSGGLTPSISLASGYGDTQNPYASKTANFFLAAPNGAAGAPTFRAIVAADIPTLNQNTTGSAGSVANAVTFNNGGAGDASGTTFNGSAARTVSYNTVGAPSTTGTNATGTWAINISGNAATATSATSAGSTTVVAATANNGIQSAYQTTINTTTPGLGLYGVHFNGQTTADYASGITWNGGTTTTNANAGIYVQGSGAYGTKMYIATTDSYAVGSKTAISIDHTGLVNFVRVRPTALGNTILDAGNYNSYAPTLTGTGASGTWGISVTGNSATTSQRNFSGDISTGGQGRFTGWYTGNAATGLAAEIGISAGQGYIFTYNRDTSTYGILNIAASAANMQFSGSTINVNSGALQQNGNQVLHAGNYNSYAPTLTGTGASGTWGINITGTVNGLTLRLGGGSQSTNVAISSAALFNNTSGTYNTAIGSSALNAISTTSYNTAVGGQAGLFALGGLNTWIGSSAGVNITGSENTAVGVNSMYGVYIQGSTALGNSAFGKDSLYNISSGQYNTAIGYNSLFYTTTSNFATAVGYQSAFSNTTGAAITAIGTQALYNNLTGSNHTAVGYLSMFYMRGDNNTGIGSFAMRGSTTAANNTGSNNTAVGFQSLQSISSGSNNVGLGHQALYTLVSGNNNVAIGYQSYYGNTDSGAGNVAIGYQTAAYQFYGKTGSGNVLVGDQAGYYLLSGNGNVAVGQLAGNNLNQGSYNVFMGYYAGWNSYGANNVGNVYIGQQAGYNAGSTSYYNVAIGAYALDTYTTNTGYNVAVGVEALGSNTTPNYNVGVGAYAFVLNSTGTGNTGLGGNAAYNNTTGSSNTAVGQSALYSNTTSSNQTAIGYQAMYNMRGGDNTATGYQAMYGTGTPSSNTGASNVANGYQALYNTSAGFENVAVGFQAAWSNTSAGRNIAIGYRAAYTSNGFDNVAVGYQALYNQTTGANNVAIGNYAGFQVTTGGSLVAVGDSAAYSMRGADNTAIGQAAMVGSGTPANNTGTSNVALGSASLYGVSSGARNTAIGASSLRGVTTGTDNVALGFGAGYRDSAFNTTNATTTGTFNIYIGGYAYPGNPTATRELVIGYNITGKGSNSGFISVGGSIYQGNNTTTWATTSDVRIKENFVPVTDGLAIINALEPFEFDYILTGKHDVGFKAQQYKTVLPDQITKHAASEEEKQLVGEDELYGIQRNLDPYLVSAIKSLTEQVKALQQEIAQLKGA